MPIDEIERKGSVSEVKRRITEAIETTARSCMETLLPERNCDLHCGQTQR